MFALALTLSVLFSGALSLLCPSQIDPSVTVNVAHPTTCAKYMSCVHTQPREMNCPGGLEWNDHDSLCDYPGRSGCVRNVPEEVARLNGSALAAASVCLPQETSGCPLNSSPGEVALRKHRNCRMYYSCSLGKESPMYCPKGLYWNAGSCRCDYESDVECGEDGERPVEEEEEQEAVEEVPVEVQEQAEEQQGEEPQQEEEQPDQEEPTQEHETYEFPEDFEQPSILLAEPQVEYEPSPRLRFRREAGETTESSNSAGSTGAESSSSTTVAENSGSSDSPGSSGGSGGSGNSGGSGGSGGNKPIEGGNGDGTVAAGAGIREVSAFAVMLATLILNAM